MKRTLNALFREVVQEAEINPSFRARLEAALGFNEQKLVKATGAKQREKLGASPKRPSNRRPPAVLDPVHLARQGEEALRSELGKLDIEQLRDVVAEYGMDTGKLVLKWRDSERIIERIVEVARARAQKGSAFRDQASTEASPSDSTTDQPRADDAKPRT